MYTEARLADLIIQGDGSLRAELERVTRDLGVERRVHFAGPRTESIQELLGAADAFVLASDWEGNPLALMEAAAAGLPVVSTRVGGVPESCPTERRGFS